MMMMMSNRQPQGAVGKHVGGGKDGDEDEGEVQSMRTVHMQSQRARISMQQQKTRHAHLGPSPATHQKKSGPTMNGQLGDPMGLGAKGGATMTGIGKDGLGIAMLIGTSALASNG